MRIETRRLRSRPDCFALSSRGERAAFVSIDDFTGSTPLAASASRTA
jgi:hypothetical protein